MSSLRQIVGCTAILFAIAVVQPAYAGSGALRNETIDAQTIAMGNAFVGEANTPAAVYYNPAGLNQIDTMTMTLNDDVIAPRAHFVNTSGADTQMLNHEYDIPGFYSVVPLIKNKLTIGAGSGSYWGLGSDWGQHSSLRYVAGDSTLENTDSMLTAAYQITNPWSVAVSVDNDYSKADESRLFLQNGVNDAGLDLKAKDDAWGYRLATLYKINDQNQVGLMYRSPITHNYVGKLYLDGLNNSGMYPYAAIFGGSSYQTRVTEKLTLPQSVVMGYSFKPTQKWTLNLDLEWMDWASIKHESLGFPDVANPSLISTILNTGNPLVHDWSSAWSEAIGTEYKLTDRFRLRAGFYHHGTVGPDSYFDPAISDVQAFGVTGGFGYDITKNISLDVGYSAQFVRPRKVATILGAGTANGKYYEFINTGSVSLTYKF